MTIPGITKNQLDPSSRLILWPFGLEASRQLAGEEPVGLAEVPLPGLQVVPAAVDGTQTVRQQRVANARVSIGFVPRLPVDAAQPA